MEEDISLVEKDYIPQETEIKDNIELPDVLGVDQKLKGEEVLTNKISHDGRKIYRQVMTTYGALPNATSKTVEFPTVVSETQVNQITHFEAMNDSGSNFLIPNSFTTASGYVYWGAFYDSSNLRAACVTSWNPSTYTADYIVVEYTRTDK